MNSSQKRAAGLQARVIQPTEEDTSSISEVNVRKKKPNLKTPPFGFEDTSSNHSGDASDDAYGESDNPDNDDDVDDDSDVGEESTVEEVVTKKSKSRTPSVTSTPSRKTSHSSPRDPLRSSKIIQDVFRAVWLKYQPVLKMLGLNNYKKVNQ